MRQNPLKTRRGGARETHGGGARIATQSSETTVLRKARQDNFAASTPRVPRQIGSDGGYIAMHGRGTFAHISHVE
jgi:hypothetical protein